MAEEKKAERRESARIRKHQHATLRRAGAGQPLPVQVMNVSDGGARLIAAESFDAAESVVLALDEKETGGVVLESKKLFNGFSIRVRFASAS